ncbi:hypothetical protein DFH28DRAFT_982567 [Melampsora americana]|nr:hypothetical protein DFH28DRAFT_982567 [Melampsora americana]
MMTSRYASRPSHSSNQSPSLHSTNHQNTHSSLKKSTRNPPNDEPSQEPSEPVASKTKAVVEPRADTHERSPTPSPPRPTRRKLPPRRAATRTDEQRLREMFGDDPFPNRLEQLKKNASIDVANESGDLSTSAAVALAQNDRTQLTNRSDRHQVKASNEFEYSPSNPLTGDSEDRSRAGPSLRPSEKAQKRPLKRRAQDRPEFDTNRYHPGTDEIATLEPTSSVSSPPRTEKRPRLRRDQTNSSNLVGIRSTGIGGRIEIQDINNIEGPATAMLRGDAERQKINRRKHKIDAGDLRMSTDDSRKRLRAISPIEVGSDSDESTSRQRRKRNQKSNTTPKRSKVTSTSKRKGNGKVVMDEQLERFLVVKTHGKKMTDQELDANREFNKLRISKPILLSHIPSECRRIGWNEVDLAEEEIREMDQWTKADLEDGAAQCSFQVEYVSMLRKTVNLKVNERVAEDSGPNFKRFKPKNARLTSYTPVERPLIPLETVRLKGVADWDSPPKGGQSGRDRKKDTGIESEEEAIEFLNSSDSEL